jgi:hypothetical protein
MTLLLLLAACSSDLPATDDTGDTGDSGDTGDTSDTSDTGDTGATTYDGVGRLSDDCLPTDGAGIRLLIGLPEASCSSVAEGQSLQLTVPGSFPPVAGTTYAWTTPNDGSGTYIDATSTQSYLVSGSITVDTSSSDTGLDSGAEAPLTGHYTAVTDAGVHLAGSFTASVCDVGIVCG